jgi:hypothetical protein
MSSRSSLLSASPSVSSAKPRVKAIRHGIKRIKETPGTVTRPAKRAKHALSNVSTPVVSDDENPASEASEDEAPSTKVIDVLSDGEELDDLQKELGMFIFPPCHNTISFIVIHSSGQGNLAVPDICLFQNRRND